MTLAGDMLFLAGLALKVALTAGIIVTASIVVERSGPFIGAMIAALPTAAGAAYIILAVEHPPAFVAASAVGSMAANAAVGLFSFAYAMIARRHGVIVSLAIAVVLWLVCAAALRTVSWTVATAMLLNLAVYGFTFMATRPLRRVAAKTSDVKPTRRDIAMRALTVGLFVAVVTTLSHKIGSFASGMFAVFPVAMASFMAILHPRIGGVAAGSVLAHAQIPLLGLPLGFAALHVLAEPIGVWWAFLAGLLVCVAWNGLLWALRRVRA